MIGSILIVLENKESTANIYNNNSKRKCILKNYRCDYVTKSLSNK